MRVTLVGPVYPYRGGIAHHTATLATALQSAGHSVQVVSFRRQYPSWLYPGRTDQDPSHLALKVKAEFILDPLKPWSWFQAASRIIETSPDLTVIQWWTTFWAPVYATLATLLNRRRLRVAYLVHNVLPHETKPWDASLAKLALRRGRFFIAQSSRERDRLAALIPKADIRLCTLPAFQRFSEQQLTQSEARKRLGLPEGTPVLLFFGIVREYKGLRYLLEAIAKLDKEKNEKVHLLIAGEFWEDVNVYQKLLSDLNISERVFIDDRYIPNEQADLLFSAADALVAPYVDGTQSAAAGLAMGYSLPLIVTAPVAQGINAKNTGFLREVPPKDARALADAILELIHHLPVVSEEKPFLHDWELLVDIINELAMSDRNNF